MKVCIAGGGRVGMYLAQSLLSHHHKVTIIEPQEPLCIQIIEIFPRALYLSAPGNVLYYKNKKSVRFLRPALKALRTTR